MTNSEITNLLTQLIFQWESEIVEFKRGKKEFSLSDIGKYFSAIANEANLRKHDFGWLIFGIDNQTRKIIGTDFKSGESDRIQAVSNQIAQGTQPSLTFRNIFEVASPEGKVIMFQIPAAPPGSPVAYNGHYYARAGESLVALGLDKLYEINHQETIVDWSAQIVNEASISDLDKTALLKAKHSFAKKMEGGVRNLTPQDVLDMNDEEFLTKARLLDGGKIPRATLLLLGKAESAYLLSPHPCSMVWSLEDNERAYEHFYPPFILATTELYKKIRNFQIRILPEDELVPIEVSKYNQRVVLEALHNCIAHQDYTKNA